MIENSSGREKKEKGRKRRKRRRERRSSAGEDKKYQKKIGKQRNGIYLLRKAKRIKVKQYIRFLPKNSRGLINVKLGHRASH